MLKKTNVKSSCENGPYVPIPVPTVRDVFQHLSDVFTEIEKTDTIVSDVVMTPEFWENLKKHILFEDSCDLGSRESYHIGYVWGSKIWLSEIAVKTVAYGENDPKFKKDWPAFANGGRL